MNNINNNNNMCTHFTLHLLFFTNARCIHTHTQIPQTIGLFRAAQTPRKREISVFVSVCIFPFETCMAYMTAKLLDVKYEMNHHVQLQMFRFEPKHFTSRSYSMCICSNGIHLEELNVNVCSHKRRVNYSADVWNLWSNMQLLHISDEISRCTKNK